MSKRQNLLKLFYSKLNAGLLSIVLLLLIVFLMSKVPFIFAPLEQFINIVVFPVVLTFILYYLAKPVVDFFEKKKIPRVVTILLLAFLAMGFLVLSSWILFPIIEQQLNTFAKSLPTKIQSLNQETQKFFNQPILSPIREKAYEQVTQVNDYIKKYGSQASTIAVRSMGTVWDVIEKTLLGLIMAPFMLFFLLKDDKHILPSILTKMPKKWRAEVKSIVYEIHQKLYSYIRGQLVISLFVTVLLILGFWICRLNYGITLALIAGILNFLVPTFGAWIGAIPAFIVAILESPLMLLWVFLIFYLVQHLQSHLVAPFILGNQLNIHPLTILILLLWAGKEFGFVGLVLVIPIYASVKVVVEHLFKWYKKSSGLYD